MTLRYHWLTSSCQKSKLINSKTISANSTRITQNVVSCQKGGEYFRVNFINVLHSGSSLNKEPPRAKTITIDTDTQKNATTHHVTAITVSTSFSRASHGREWELMLEAAYEVSFMTFRFPARTNNTNIRGRWLKPNR